jgi:hypothetical protein
VWISSTKRTPRSTNQRATRRCQPNSSATAIETPDTVQCDLQPAKASQSCQYYTNCLAMETG